MPHANRLREVIARVLSDRGLAGAYDIDVYRAHALDDWRVILLPTSRNKLELCFTIGAAPDWETIAQEATRQIDSAHT